MEGAAKRVVNWRNSVFFFASPLAAAAGVFFYARAYGIGAGDVVAFTVMMAVSAVGIIPGYHRYFAHRTYECSRGLQIFYLLAATSGFHQSALVWASEHRDHHRFVDTARDPYNIRQGFLWAHIGWVLHGTTRQNFDNAPDLLSDPMVRAQHRWWLPLGIATGFGVPTLIGLAFGSAMGGLIFGGLLRLVVFQHCTFLVNSAAHTSGKQPYTAKESARDSWWLSFVTFGEGRHNYHHAFPGDYRIGHAWWDFDPAKWWIASMGALGLARRLHRTPKAQIERARRRTLPALSDRSVAARHAARRDDDLPELQVARAKSAGALQ